MSAVSVSEITAPFRPFCDYSSLSLYALSSITLPEYKNSDFVLERPENGGPEGQKRTKMPILCSRSGKTGFGKKLPVGMGPQQMSSNRANEGTQLQNGKLLLLLIFITFNENLSKYFSYE